jgi:hypothetical protein
MVLVVATVTGIAGHTVPLASDFVPITIYTVPGCPTIATTTWLAGALIPPSTIQITEEMTGVVPKRALRTTIDGPILRRNEHHVRRRIEHLLLFVP